jgi:thiosulfate dehydrogenase (quinone) large subunit
MDRFNLNGSQKTALVLLRLLIGWHFLYEGVIKLYNPSWTAKGYLLSAEFLKPVFALMAKEGVIGAIDTLNISLLIIVGVLLIAGFKTSWASIGGMLLLALYYLAHPPFTGITQGPAEGSYWIVNKNLIELAALYVLYLFPTSDAFGIEGLFKKQKLETANP